MSVHYKFKAALDYSTITFDGISISVADLKKAIIDQKRYAKSADSDLQITNAQTKEVYETEDSLIPKNTSVIVARVPVTSDKKKSNNGAFGAPGSGGGAPFHQRHNRHLQPLPASAPVKVGPVAPLEGSEEERLRAVMMQSTADYDPSTYARFRGQSQMGRVPNNYRCYNCNQTGHWKKDCPLGHQGGGGGGEASDGLRKSTGIPRSFMVVVDGPGVPGALITPEGRYAVPAVDHAAYTEKNKPQPVEPPVPKPDIPEDLLCKLCNDLLTDAILVPCCANSYCDECIRNILLESEEQECPGCSEKDTSPNSLMPNRFLRKAVENFKNETGYAKPVKVIEVVRPPPTTVDLTNSAAAAAADRGRKLSLDDLPDDLFPHSPRQRVSESDEKADKTDPESDDKTDLYDFNDGSIPLGALTSTVPQSVPSGRKDDSMAIGTIGSKPAGNLPDRHYPPHHQRPHMGYVRSPHGQGQQNTPLHSGMPLPGGPGQSQHHYKSPLLNEPPPPGFEDAGPGESRSHGGRGDDNRDRPTRTAPPMMDGGPGHQVQGPPLGLLPNLNQPPPGYGPPPGMYPHVPGPLQPHPINFGMQHPPYRGPPHSGDMYQSSRPYPGDRSYSRDSRPPARPRYPPREQRDRLPPRERDEPHISGAIDDPLKEFERLMREKDRRKELAAAVAAGAAVKRDRSPSFTPPPRSPPSPFIKRDRSRTYSRSPSPKRQRVLVRRRKSYSRSNSRSPLPTQRRMEPRRSRSRSLRGSPPHPSQLKRRSPRRAPPFSPSPPPPPLRYPPSRKPETKLIDYHDHSRPVRYEREREREPTHSSSRYAPTSKHPSSYDHRPERASYEKKYETHPPAKYISSSSKYDAPKYDLPKKYDSKYEPSSKYESSKYDNPPSSKYDQNRGPPSRSSGSGSYYRHGEAADRHHSSRERDASREIRHFDYEQTILPPGAEPAPTGPPSLFDNIIAAPPDKQDYMKPPPLDESNYYKGKVAPAIPPLLRDRDLESLSVTPDSERGGGKDLNPTRAHKSPEPKKSDQVLPKVKVKKEKKKHRHRKKSRDEKEKKKKKRSKDKTGESAKDDTDDTVGGSDSGTQDGSRRNSGETREEGVEDGVGGVLCDSTVKSPDRLKESEDQQVSHLRESQSLERKNGLQHTGELPASAEVNTLKEAGTPKMVLKAEESESAPQKVPIPPSKWDRDDDDDVPPGTEEEPAPVVTPVQETPTIKSEDAGVVTSDILKRAESVIFQKRPPPVQAPEPRREETKSSPKHQRKSSGKHEEITAPEKSKETDSRRDKKQIVQSIQVTVDAASIKIDNIPEPQPQKRSVRDRLGSKVEDTTSTRRRSRSKDDSNRPNPTVRSEVTATRASSRERDRDRRRDYVAVKARSPIPLASIKTSIRSRSRDARPPRAYSRTRDDRQRDDRDRGRDDRNRGREERPREDRRAADLSRPRRRSRSPLRRSRSRDRRPRTPPRPLLESVRRRSRSRDRDRDLKRSSDIKPETKAEPSKPVAEVKSSEKFKPMAASDVFGSPTDKSENKSTPVPLAMRKQKRINIKLASTVSKAGEGDESSSSSSEEDPAGKTATAATAPLVAEGGDQDKDDKKKKKKEKKRRRSNSTSDSSTEEEEGKKKKKNKKKKKKKSKKKKK